MIWIFYGVAFLASLVGAICGIGGGVIIKPVFDMTGILSVSEISFLSGCIVLAMTTYSVSSSLIKKEFQTDKRTGFILAVGGAIGGIIGKSIFSFLQNTVDTQNLIGAVQSICLLLLTIGTFIYMCNKDKIQTKNFTNTWVIIIIGIALGLVSAFLGIGGGPFNLVILIYFFSMETKAAAKNSLLIIFFSQCTSLATTLLQDLMPKVSMILLTGTIICGILGGVVGQLVNHKVNNQHVDKLFMILLILITLICVYNVWHYSF